MDVYLMDVFRRRTIRNIKMWTEMDGWTDGPSEMDESPSVEAWFIIIMLI